jgi:hypothetical protein
MLATMKRSTSVFILLLLSGSALADVNTRIVWQVSRDNVNWSSSTSPTPGATIYVRAMVSYTGTAAPVGMEGFRFQPIVQGWDVRHTLLPFVNGGAGANTSTPVGVVTNTSDPTQFGRVMPWGLQNLMTANRAFGHVHTGGSGGAPAGTWLRIAQAQVTNWYGGPGNTTGGSGLPIRQLSDNGRTAEEPPFNFSLQNLEVFKFGIRLSDQVFEPYLTIDAPLNGFGNLNTTTGEREVRWYASLVESMGSIRGTPEVIPANIWVPAPGAVVTLAMGPLLLRRRRQSSALMSKSVQRPSRAPPHA